MKINLRAKAYNVLKNKIILFQLKPGDKIFEQDIAESLKTSRTPVREALLMLESEGLVTNHERLGYIVRKLSAREVEEYLSLRETLELFAAPMIIKSITPPELSSLEDNLRRAAECVGQKNLSVIVTCENEFHDILYNSVRSGIFCETISHLVDKYRWLRAISLKAPGAAQDSINGHKAMFKAIKKRDVSALKKLIHLHILEAKRRALEQGWFVLDESE